MTIQCTLLPTDDVAANDRTPLREGMYRLRHDVFCERLNWTPERDDRLEVDRLRPARPHLPRGP